eukprot:1147591-Pelagomonas_calceolata.AAC.3
MIQKNSPGLQLGSLVQSTNKVVTGQGWGGLAQTWHQGTSGTFPLDHYMLIKRKLLRLTVTKSQRTFS